MRRAHQSVLAVFLFTLPAAASAQKVEEPPICADRPTKANATCTVPAGKFQLESSFASWSLTKTEGSRTEVSQLGGSVIKLGLTDESDLQIAFAPNVAIKTKAGRITDRVSGFGDVLVRYKRRLTGDGSAVQVGLIPFVKLPIAKRGIGNGKAEGGLALPISISTGGPVTVVFGPEIGLLADGDGGGRHVQLVNLVNVSAPVTPRLTLTGELWTASNFDPANTVTLTSADAALAYTLGRTVQLDIGANFGLTRDTPRSELYSGISLRF